jgi:hypothetical protein
MGQTTIPCSETTHERLEDLRGGDFRSWDAFLNALADAYEDDGTDDLGVAGSTISGPVLDDIQKSLETVETRTGRIEKTLEDLGGRQ